ncbi:MAG: hypothetical protein LWW85_03595 [Marinilabiliales bacterium]|nr:hypothetical protein [Marinilabiliales bacterium]
MIIRATEKLLRINGIKPVDIAMEAGQPFPGEWFANTLRTGQSGKLFVFFFHRSLKISILCPTKSLRLAARMLPDRTLAFLKRHGLERLSSGLDLNSDVQISKTNDRSTLAFMNQLAKNIEWHLAMAEDLTHESMNPMEDIHANHLFSTDKGPHDYETTLDILNRF